MAEFRIVQSQQNIIIEFAFSVLFADVHLI